MGEKPIMKWRGIIYGILLAVILFWGPLACYLYAQEKPQPPALTEVQKLQIKNAAQAIELWQLKAQQAASEFEKARDAFQKLITAATPEGYVIDDQLNLVPAPKTPEKPK